MSRDWQLIRDTAIVATVTAAVKGVPGLVKLVGTLAKNGFETMFSITNEVENLRVALIKIKDVIRNADDHMFENEAQRNWLKNLKEEVHNAVNILDELERMELSRRVVDPITKKVRSLMGHPLIISSRLEESSKRLEAIQAEVHERFDPIEAAVHEFCPIVGVRDEGEVIGRKENKKMTSSSGQDTTVAAPKLLEKEIREMSSSSGQYTMVAAPMLSWREIREMTSSPRQYTTVAAQKLKGKEITEMTSSSTEYYTAAESFACSSK